MDTTNISVFSLFSGIGAFEYALKKVQSHLNINPIIVGYSEIDDNAIKVYKSHFPGIKNYGDVRYIDTSSIPDFDILVGGSPCQDFSINGKQRGLKGKNGGLFFEYIRILKEKQPKYFIFENVRGLLSNNKGDTFEIVKKAFDNAGYLIKHEILNSKDFGLPQNRERIFIIGQRKDLGLFDLKIPTTNNKTSVLKDVLEDDVDKSYFYTSEKIKKLYHGRSLQNKRACHPDKISFCLTKTGKTKWVILNKSQDFTHRFSYEKLGIDENIDDIKARSLTPEEYEQIQGFPRGYTNIVHFKYRFGCIGNGISVNVLESLYEALFSYIKYKKKDTPLMNYCTYHTKKSLQITL